MAGGYIVTGTDTGIGKTVVSALLTLGLDADYWKPVQSGLEDATDTETVKLLTGLPDDRFHSEAYKLQAPLSPHRSAELDGVVLDPDNIRLPTTARTLIVEGAGGLMVPLTREFLQIDLFRRLALPIILCARTGLGTINHTLLSVEALRARQMPVHGLIFIGDDNPDNLQTIVDLSGVRCLGTVPRMEAVTMNRLQHIFETRFRERDFL